VLTVGAGDGFLEKSIYKIGYDITCIDLDQQTVDSLRGFGIDALQEDLTTFRWTGEPFDVIIVSEVIEHLDTSTAPIAVKNLTDALIIGGHLLLTVPCKENLERSLSCCPHCGETFHQYGHVQSFDKDALSKLIISGGLTISKLKEAFFPNYHTLNIGGKISFATKHLAWLLFNRHTPGLKYFVIAVN
jgi:SAM-dependent methyltransferase